MRQILQNSIECMQFLLYRATLITTQEATPRATCFVIRNRTLYLFCVLHKLLIHWSASIIPGYMFDCHNAKKQPLYVALYEEGILLTKIESSGANDVCARCRRASVQQQPVSERRRMCR